MTTLSTTQFNVQQPITTPQAGYKFYQPYFEDYQRRLGSGVFGTPGGVGGLINQPQDIPLQQTAGMTPLMMQARYGLSGASPYTPAYDTSSQLMGEAAGGYRASTGGFNPYTMISPYYDPFESQVVDDTLERMRRTSAQQDIAGRAQDVSSGAFGGSRSRLLAKERQRESDRGIMQALAGIRSQGFQSARDAAMAENARRMAAMSGAAGGLGGIAGQVLGLGGQRQQEMMNYLNMMNQYGGQGRDIYETGLSRMYDAAMRKSQEPWERIMKGMGVLQGMKPGELVGGYGTTVPNVPPQSYQQPTGLGNVVDLATGIGNLFSLFGGGGKKDGGYIEKPKDYNAGGIVSGIVPVNMQDGGDAAQEMMDDLPDWVKEGMESENEFERKTAMDYIGTVGAIDLDPFSDLIEGGIEKLGMSGTGLEALLLSLLAAGKARKGNPKVVQQGKTALQSWQSLLNKRLRDEAAKRNARKAAEKEAKRKTAGIGGPKGKTPLLTGPGTGAGVGTKAGTEAAKRTIGQRALDVIKRNKGRLGAGAVTVAGLPLAYNYFFGDDDGEVVTADPEQFEEYLKLKQQEIEEAKTKAEKEELMADIIRTGNRLSEAMSAEGFKEVTLGDAGRIFSEERMDLPAKEAAELAALEQTAKASGMSLEEYLQLGQQDELAIRGESKESLAQKVLESGYARYGVDFQNHPDVLSGKKSGAQLRLEMMNSLMSMGYEELKSFSKKLSDEINVSANDS
jgi:hypothetical protein